MSNAALFSWLARRGFYAQLHREAAALLPEGSAADRWTDVGCGPGLMTRIAASKGYRALGIDTSDAMISAARRLARAESSTAEFRTGTTAAAPPSSVVSAVSLLAVLPDVREGLSHLWDAVLPGGSLLVVEPSAAMSPARASEVIDSSYTAADRRALLLWASARAGRAVDPTAYGLDLGDLARTPLLSGLVTAWMFRKVL